MSSSATLELENVCKKHGNVQILHGINLRVEPGEFFSLLGPSGSGKTSTLRIVAGLETTTSGAVRIDGEDVTRLAPGERDVAMVFQSYALYPHMTVFDNIAFPLRMVKTPKETVQAQVREAAERVQLSGYLDRKPGQLSGGQQQRVALARAIVRHPRLFLLDEPLSNLDAKLRVETRVHIRNLQNSLGVTTLYVTHDQEEAMALSDRMAIFLDGRVVQVGTPEEVFERPNTAGVAAFIGSPPMNLIPAKLRGNELLLGDLSYRVSCESNGREREVLVGLRPSDVRLGSEGSPTRVALVEVLGEQTLLDVYLGGTLCRARLPGKHRLATGSQIHVSLRPETFHLFDAASGERLQHHVELSIA
jgi:ABC-type sugar transport system ATPase subunit